MKIDLARLEAPFHFVATGASGVPVPIDASPDIGGTDAGARPMELLLMGLAGCSAIDVVQILGKQRILLDDIAIEVTAERAAGEEPSVFTTIRMEFTLTGDIPADKAQRAVELSVDKYCPVAAILAATATIEYTVVITGGKKRGEMTGRRSTF